MSDDTRRGRPVHTEACESHRFCFHAETGGDAHCICGADKRSRPPLTVMDSLGHSASSPETVAAREARRADRAASDEDSR